MEETKNNVTENQRAAQQEVQKETNQKPEGQKENTPSVEELLAQLAEAKVESQKYQNKHNQASNEAAESKKALRAKQTAEEREAEEKAAAQRKSAALNITRKIQKQAGTNLKAYKAVGTLEDRNVEEGKIIPLSHYKTEPITFDEITLKKWRKATSAEAIIEKGDTQAVTMTTDRMLKDVQKGIRNQFLHSLREAQERQPEPHFRKHWRRRGGSCKFFLRMTISRRFTS